MKFQSKIIVSVLFISAGTLSAQVAPPFFGDATAFDPEIDVLTYGTMSEMQATVSYDRKYVTLNVHAVNSQATLQRFTFERGVTVNRGFVGAAPQSNSNSPAAIAAAENAVLDRTGTVLLSPR